MSETSQCGRQSGGCCPVGPNVDLCEAVGQDAGYWRGRYMELKEGATPAGTAIIGLYAVAAQAAYQCLLAVRETETVPSEDEIGLVQDLIRRADREFGGLVSLDLVIGE